MDKHYFEKLTVGNREKCVQIITLGEGNLEIGANIAEKPSSVLGERRTIKPYYMAATFIE